MLCLLAGDMAGVVGVADAVGVKNSFGVAWRKIKF
jgi:hypothetical protein